MIIIVDDRIGVCEAYAAAFFREGVSTLHFGHAAFAEYLEGLTMDQAAAVEAVILGDDARREASARQVRRRLAAPLIALTDQRSLQQTLALFDAGFDDVVGKPAHARELLARVRSIARRQLTPAAGEKRAEIVLFADGRDPVVGGEVLSLPRRERRILECLYDSQQAWLTKAQIFNRVYGVMSERIDESVIESHICRLRRRIRARLGYDPVQSQRFMGYRLVLRASPGGCVSEALHQSDHDRSGPAVSRSIPVVGMSLEQRKRAIGLSLAEGG